MPRGRKPKVLEPVQVNHSDGASIVQIDYKSEKWTVSKLVDFLRKNKIRDDMEIQRGVCWSAKQRSLFIHSIIMDYYVPPLLMAKTESKEYDLLDGKQRSSALKDFIKDGFRLKDVPTVPYDDGTEEDFNGLKFSQLPQEVREVILGYKLNVVTFGEGTTKEQAEDVFYRSNNGTALRASDKNFSKAVSKDKITPLMSHEIFDRAMTESAREKLAPRQVIINSYILLLTDNYSIDAGDVSKFLSEYEISEENMNTLSGLFTRLHSISEEIEENTDPGTLDRKASKRILSRVNIPVLIKFLTTHENDEENSVFFQYFFSGEKKATQNDEYNLASQSGSGHLENIQRRLSILNKEYEDFQNTDEEE